jgi:hypothetical protein
MGYRKFTDRDGNAWEVRDHSQSEWMFVPLPGNPVERTAVPAPGYDNDPFELSKEELQKLLDAAGPPRSGRQKKSPFLD